MRKKKTIIGLTGISCSGKTTACLFFARLGAKIIDADKIAHAVLKQKHMKLFLKRTFGNEIFKNGKLSTKKLAALTFGHKKNLKLLNSITHPSILTLIKERIDAVSDGIVVVDAPLLIESNLFKKMDINILVKSKPDKLTQRCRLIGITPEQLKKRYVSQLPQSQKEKYVDFVVDNNGSKKDLEKNIKEIWRKI